MNEQEKRKLSQILNTLKKMQIEIESLFGEDRTTVTKDTHHDFDVSAFLKRIQSLNLTQLKEELNTLKHTELGQVFVEVGGSSGDKKKPKAFLIERILWLSKEFSEGHRSIRDSNK
jgi:hypothetical protein